MRRISRRSFLRRAALAGTAFAVPACRHLAVAPRHDVVVLGAGVAGLSAARELMRAGLDVVVLEARGRVGGRLHTLEQPAPHGLELGAQVIHGSRAASWELIREFGIQTRPLSWHGRQGFLQRDGRLVDIDEERERAVTDRLQRAYRAYRGPDLSWREFCQRLDLDELDASLAAEQARSYSAEPDQIGTRSVIEDGAAWSLYLDQNYQVVGGYRRLAAGLAHPLGDRIRLESIVERVSWGGSELEVAYQRAGSRSTLRARRGLITLPLGVLQTARPAFDPPLPAWKRRSIDSLAMGRAVVMPLLFRKAFWRERRPGLQGWGSHVGGVQFWDPHPPGVGAPVLQSWLVGDAARQVSALGPERGLQQVLLWLEEAFPGADARRELEWSGLGDWVGDPFALGSYSFTRPGGLGQRAALATAIADRLYFAGEATAQPPHYQTVHGAYTSGRRSAREILAALGVELTTAVRDSRLSEGEPTWIWV